VRHGLWMIFGGFTHPIYSVYSRYIICFTVPLCPCITGLGSEQPLFLFYLLYSFVPTKKKQKKRGAQFFFYPPQAVGRRVYCVVCYVFLVVSCKIAPLHWLIFHVILSQIK
jgi:hypothetical protein